MCFFRFLIYRRAVYWINFHNKTNSFINCIKLSDTLQQQLDIWPKKTYNDGSKQIDKKWQ